MLSFHIHITLLPSLLKSGDQVYQKVINQLYQKMLLLNLLITYYW